MRALSRPPFRARPSAPAHLNRPFRARSFRARPSSTASRRAPAHRPARARPRLRSTPPRPRPRPPPSSTRLPPPAAPCRKIFQGDRLVLVGWLDVQFPCYSAYMLAYSSCVEQAFLRLYRCRPCLGITFLLISMRCSWLRDVYYTLHLLHVRSHG